MCVGVMVCCFSFHGQFFVLSLCFLLLLYSLCFLLLSTSRSSVLIHIFTNIFAYLSPLFSLFCFSQSYEFKLLDKFQAMMADKAAS
jgi:hypothetical protein